MGRDMRGRCGFPLSGVLTGRLTDTTVNRQELVKRWRRRLAGFRSGLVAARLCRRDLDARSETDRLTPGREQTDAPAPTTA